MLIKDLYEKWDLKRLKVKTPILDMEWAPSDVDKNAAWDLYVELLTRITTQKLPDEHGIEITALESIYSLFQITWQTLKHHGRKAIDFSRIAIIVLNQIEKQRFLINVTFNDRSLSEYDLSSPTWRANS